MKQNKKKVKGYYKKISGKKVFVKPYLRYCRNQNSK